MPGATDLRTRTSLQPLQVAIESLVQQATDVAQLHRPLRSSEREPGSDDHERWFAFYVLAIARH